MVSSAAMILFSFIGGLRIKISSGISEFPRGRVEFTRFPSKYPNPQTLLFDFTIFRGIAERQGGLVGSSPFFGRYPRDKKYSPAGLMFVTQMASTCFPVQFPALTARRIGNSPRCNDLPLRPNKLLPAAFSDNVLG